LVALAFTEETCKRLAIDGTKDAKEVARLRNWYDEHAFERAQRLGDCIVFPYPGMVGFALLDELRGGGG
jgi:hypothetical protein